MAKAKKVSRSTKKTNSKFKPKSSFWTPLKVTFVVLFAIVGLAFVIISKAASVNGLTAAYYNETGFTSPAFTRVDSKIDNNWQNGSPDSQIQPDTFSVRWSGQISTPVTGNYQFTTYSDDGVRLWIDGKLIIDNWTLHPPTYNHGTITLTKGKKYNIRMDYYENTGRAVAKLSWKVPGKKNSVIVPAANLWREVEAPDPTPPPPPGPNPTPAPSGSFISMVSYPGWTTDSVPPSKIDYTPYTHIFSFGMYPKSDGRVDIGDMQSADNVKAQVTAAHAAGRKIILVIGSEGTGDWFAGAASNANRAKFVNNIVNTMKTYGYDGVDIDWEEKVPQNQANFVALIKELRVKLNTVTPRPYFSFDVISGLVPPSLAAQLHTHVDSINMMSYWSNGLDEYNAYTKAGVPANKLTLGIGMSDGYYDSTQARVQAKVDLVKAKGMLGTEFWQIDHLKAQPDGPGYLKDPRLIPLRNAVAGH